MVELSALGWAAVGLAVAFAAFTAWALRRLPPPHVEAEPPRAEAEPVPPAPSEPREE